MGGPIGPTPTVATLGRGQFQEAGPAKSVPVPVLVLVAHQRALHLRNGTAPAPARTRRCSTKPKPDQTFLVHFPFANWLLK